MSLTDGRLGARPSRALVDHVNAVELSDELDAVHEFVLIDLAHALMLTRQNIFDRRRGRSLVAALLKLLENEPRDLVAGDPEIGTITLQLERYLEEECGPAGLDIQRARSRIERFNKKAASRSSAFMLPSSIMRLCSRTISRLINRWSTCCRFELRPLSSFRCA